MEIDYIHGDEALHGLVKETKGCGIFLQSIDKKHIVPCNKCGRGAAQKDILNWRSE